MTPCGICGEVAPGAPGWTFDDPAGEWICPSCADAGRKASASRGLEVWISEPPAPPEPGGWEDVP